MPRQVRDNHGAQPECAARAGASIDQLLSAAAAEKLSALMTVEHLRQRARRARREDFLAFLDASPDVPPVPGDEPATPQAGTTEMR